MPVSRMFPGVDRSFIAGLRGALTRAGVDHRLAIEPVGNCAVRDHVVERIQRLLLEHAPAVVTGIMGAGLSRHVHGFFSDARTPFIVNDLGGDPMMTGGTRNPFVFSNSFNLWQSMYALGYWASQHLGTRAVVAAALHEAGYGIVQAFWLGFASAGGGEIVATEVTHRQSADDDPSEHIRRIGALAPDFVMAFYAGREGVSFMKAWGALGLHGRIPMIASPLMTHDVWLPQMGGHARGLRTAFSWDMSRRPVEHEQFRQAAQVEAGQDPAVFALLGYETGAALATAVDRMQKSPGLSMRDALDGLAFESPRGTLTFDAATGEVGTTDYLQVVSDTGARETLATIALPPPFQADYETVRDQEDRSGWINPYLVT